jgi:hypothetical protein
MTRKKSIPPRIKTSDTRRREYQKSLEASPVTRTGDSYSATGKDFMSIPSSDGTIYTPEEGEHSPAPYKQIMPAKKFKWSEHVQNIAAVIGIIIFIGVIVKAYDSLTNQIDNIKSDLTTYKQDMKEDIRHLTERMDKYVSKKP